MPRAALVASLVVSSVLGLAAPARAGGDDCGLEPPGTPPGLPVPPKPFERAWTKDTAPVLRREDPPPRGLRSVGIPAGRLRPGSLTGKTVYVSAGHGFVYNDVLKAYATQRGNTNTIVEDFVSNETVSQFLIPMLSAAGATVRPVREPDPNPNMVIVDDGTPGYEETGAASLYSFSTVAGFGPIPDVVSDTTSFFLTGKNRLVDAAATATAQAVYTPDIPESGYYNVYVTYTAFTARVDDAHYVVRHPGGEAHFRVNQQRHGGTWLLLGRYYFYKGKDAAKGAVLVLNDSKNPAGKNVSLDAVRFGGGMGLAYDQNQTGQPAAGRGKSTRPHFDEAARLGAQWFGAPRAVYDNPSLEDRDDDVSTRAKFAKWDHEPGEPAVFVSWHTNAPIPGTGTTTYIYGSGGPGACTVPSPTAGSDKLAAAVHGELVRDARAGWAPGWRDHGVQCAFFGEVNPTNNDEMPQILVEVAYHDTPADAVHLKEPQFRYLAARAFTQGIIRYFSQVDGVEYRLPPEPPTGLRAVNLGAGKVSVRWEPALKDGADLAGDVATGFRVYQSADGLSWDEGTETTGKAVTLVLSPGVTRFLRVAAVNEGGESFPSEAVAVRTSIGEKAAALVVSGFSRWDASGAFLERLTQFSLGSPVRAFMTRINDGASVRSHGDGLGSAGVPFDGATADAFGAGLVSSGYAVIDWVGGRGTPGGGALEVPERNRLTQHLAAGGHLIFSSSQAAAALAVGSPEDQAFLSDKLCAAPADRLGLTAPDGGQLAMLPADPQLDAVGRARLDDGTQGTYPGVREVEFEYPGDGGRFTAKQSGMRGLALLDGGQLLGVYEGSNAAAVVGCAKAGAGKVAFVGFPIETVSDAAARRALLAQLLGWLAPGLGEDAGTTVDDGGTIVGEDGGALVEDAGVIEKRIPALDPMLDGELAKTGCGCASAADAGWLVALGALVPLLARRRHRRG